MAGILINFPYVSPIEQERSIKFVTWRPIETILRYESVPEKEIDEVRNFFLESMLETQSDLSESEFELIKILLMLLEEGGGEGIFNAEEIADKIERKPREDMTQRGLQIWVGRT